MSSQSARHFLVLGGIRSGKSELAEELVSGVGDVRYVATAGAGVDDPAWTARIEAHRARRPSGWAAEEIGADPDRLVTLLAEAKPDEALLIDDLGGWLTATLDAAGAWKRRGAGRSRPPGRGVARRGRPRLPGRQARAREPGGRTLDRPGDGGRPALRRCDGRGQPGGGRGVRRGGFRRRGPADLDQGAEPGGAVAAPPAFAPVTARP